MTFPTAAHVTPAVSGASGGMSALEHYVAPLREVLADEAITDLCINRPGEAFVLAGTHWQRVALPFATLPWCQGFVRLVAASTQQALDGERPLLSASLPSGERLQVVTPPAIEPGAVAIAVRRAARIRRTLEDLVGSGSGGRRAEALPASTVAGDGPAENGRLGGGEGEDMAQRLRAAVRARKNILVSGATGSGKTTLTNALIAEIPSCERLVVIEDAAELVLERHPNALRLLYSKDGQGLAKQLTAKRLLEASLRLRPDRILLAELRGEEAFDYLRSVNSGHPGSITSIHAASPVMALRQLALLVRESAAGRALGVEEVKELVGSLVDVIVQCGVDEHGVRGVVGVWEGEQVQ